MFSFLRTTTPIESSFFHMSRFGGTVCGFWPQPRLSYEAMLRFAVTFFLIGLGTVGEVVYGFIHLDDIKEALDAFCPAFSEAVCVIKMLMFLVRRSNWLRIVQRMRALLLHDLNAEKRLIIQQHSAVGNALTLALLTASSMTSVCFVSLPLVRNVWRLWHGQPIVPGLPFKVALPAVLLRNPIYPWTFAVITLSAVAVPCNISSVDGFFMFACLYLRSLFRVLEHDIRRLFDAVPAPAQQAELRRKLASIIDRHNAIIDLCVDLSAEFELIILVHFMSASLVVCLSIFNMMLMSASASVIVYVFYSLTAMTQLFFYCNGGSQVSDSSLEIAHALYDVEWYSCDSKTRKMILMMQRRAQKPITIAVPFFTLTRPAFATIIRTAGSYIALLKTFFGDN